MKIALLCGGPSLERGISLNSARSVLDHLQGAEIEITPIYFDHHKKAYAISEGQLYSNTPSDFDFKLQETARALSQKELIATLKRVDIAFPVIHGAFGEDGELQTFLEKHKIPFVGTGSQGCTQAFDKFNSKELIAKHGFYTLPSMVLETGSCGLASPITGRLEAFFTQHHIKRAVVKPAAGGSSIGVFSVDTVDEALEKVEYLFHHRKEKRVVIEPFAEGIEFTVIILQNRFGLPIAILPTEIETDYSAHQIFDYRKKYLATRQVAYHCPPRFSNEMIEKIQIQAEQLFALLGMRDFARFDGWLLNNGELWFSDFNPISGMEQNSFLFQQASRIGFSHRGVIRFVVDRALHRYGKALPSVPPQGNKQRIHVLFGGNTSERQVSLMSGTNVWLKLRQSEHYDPKPFLLDLDGQHVWRLPYPLALNHTVEEIVYNCEHEPEHRERLASLEAKARLRMGLSSRKGSDEFGRPEKMTLVEFIAQSPRVFLALHGGIGENGTLQHLLKEKGIGYNGPSEHTCRLCMDKWQTSQFLAEQQIEGVLAIPGQSLNVIELLSLNQASLHLLWQRLKQDLSAKTLVVKPRADGCSSGIVHLFNETDFSHYCEALREGLVTIPTGTFAHQSTVVEMPLTPPENLLVERFIETDRVQVKGKKLIYQKVSGWVEMTVGVVEHHRKLQVLNPSITIAEGEVLSLEEKFQGGTGVNITPPPESLISKAHLQKVKAAVLKVAEAISLTGYCRIDIFVELTTGQISVIEVNSLPGLTPSTVLYHQALAEHPPIYPKAFLESLIRG